MGDRWIDLPLYLILDIPVGSRAGVVLWCGCVNVKNLFNLPVSCFLICKMEIMQVHDLLPMDLLRMQNFPDFKK